MFCLIYRYFKLKVCNVLGFIYVVAGNKHPKIILDNYEFVINRKCENRTMWKCCHYAKTSCRSRLVTFGKNVRYTLPHNHSPTFLDNLAKCHAQWVNIIRIFR